MLFTFASKKVFEGGREFVRVSLLTPVFEVFSPSPSSVRPQITHTGPSERWYGIYGGRGVGEERATEERTMREIASQCKELLAHSPFFSLSLSPFHIFRNIHRISKGVVPYGRQPEK